MWTTEIITHTMSVILVVFNYFTGEIEGASYEVPGEVSSNVIQLQGYKTMINNDMKFILNCSSSETALVERTAEFLLNGNTINYIHSFHGKCYQSINKSLCYPEICDCHVDEKTLWYYIVIENRIEHDEVEQFSCFIRGNNTSGIYELSFEGIWSKNESKSRAVQVSRMASFSKTLLTADISRQKILAVVLFGGFILVCLWIYKKCKNRRQSYDPKKS